LSCLRRQREKGKMRGSFRRFIAVLGVVVICLSAGAAVAQDLPVVKGKKVVASIGGEPITLDELQGEIAGVKKELPAGQKVDRKQELEVLQRMITTRLIAQEARRIGLDALPEVKKTVESYGRVALREELVERLTKNVKADEKEVERIYRDSTREWKISALFWEKEEEAKGLEAALKKEKNFGELAKRLVEERKAKKAEVGIALKPKDMDPDLRAAVSGLAVGATSSVIRTKSGFVILRLEEVRTAEDPEARERARHIALTSARLEAVKAQDEALKKKYVTVRQDVLKSVDYESPTPGFEALLKDRRVVAEVKGEAPVTVGEMTQEMRYEFFHGVEGAAERKRLNAKKEQTLNGMLHRKVFRKEALRLGLDKTDSYRRKVQEHEIGTLFGAFMAKVIAPEIKVSEDELKAYYSSHMQEFTAPGMIRVRSLAFATRREAEGAVEKLKKGTEFQWLAAHAEGQVGKDAKGPLTFDGRLVVTEELPDGVRKALAGAKAGESRLYAGPEGYFYALAVQEVVAAAPQPYEEARPAIAKKVAAEKPKKAVEEYADKLRALSEVKVYLKS